MATYEIPGFFEPLSMRDAADRSGVDGNGLAFVFADPGADGDLRTRAKAMKAFAHDPINGASRICRTALPSGFTVGLERVSDQALLSVTTMSFAAHANGRLDVSVDLVFTDCRERGKGYARLLAAAAGIMVERTAEAWHEVDSAEGSGIVGVEIRGERMSDGGSRFIESLQRHADDVMDVVEERFMPEMSPR